MSPSISQLPPVDPIDPPKVKRPFWQWLTEMFYGYDFFISYAHVDGRIYAERLERGLRERRYDCFLDTDSYVTGDDWKPVGAWSLQRTTKLVLVCTPGAMKSGPVLRELRIFTSKGKRIIPIEFSADEPSQALPEDHPMRAFIAQSVLRLAEPGQQLAEGPSQSVVEALDKAFKKLRWRTVRRLSMMAFMSALVTMLCIAHWQAQEAEAQRRVAVAQGREANHQLASVQWLEAKRASDEHLPLKAAHNLLRAALSHTSANEPAAARDALLAAKLAGPRIHWTAVHDDRVFFVAVSPDGARVLTSSADGTARLWNSHTGQPEGKAMKHPENAQGAKYSPDGKRIVTWCLDGFARLWTAEGDAIGQPMPHMMLPNDRHGPSFDSESKTLLTWSLDDGEMRLWNTCDGSALGKRMEHTSIAGAMHCPGRQRFISWGADHTAVLWSGDGRPLARLRHDPSVTYPACSPDGRLIATLLGDALDPPADGRNEAQFHSTNDGSLVGASMVHAKPIHDLCFSPDSQRLATWSGDTAQFWRAPDGTASAKTMNHGAKINPALFSPDGGEFITLGSRRLSLWDGRTGEAHGSLDLKLAGASFALNVKASRILSWSGDAAFADGPGDAIAFDQSCQPIGAPLRHERSVNAAMFAPDDHRVLTASSDGTARCWAPESSRIGDSMVCKSRINGAAYDADGHRVLTWCDDGQLRWWNADDGSPTGEPMQNDEAVLDAIRSADGRKWLIRSPGDVRVWDLEAGATVGSAMPHLKLEGACWSTDARRILTWTQSIARLWDAVQNSALSPELPYASTFSNAPSLSSDGELMATFRDTNVNLWSAANGANTAIAHPRSVHAMTFSRDDKLLITCCSDGLVRFFDAHSGAASGEPITHGSHAIGLELNPQGSLLLTWDAKIARLWSLPDRKPIGRPMKHLEDIRRVLFSDDNRWIVTLSADGLDDSNCQARLWTTSDGIAVGEPMTNVIDVTFGSSAELLATWSKEGTIKLWSTRGGKFIAALDLQAEITSASFNSDETRLLISSSSGTAIQWDLSFDAATPAAEQLLDFEIRSGTTLGNDRQVRVLNFDEWLRKQSLQKAPKAAGMGATNRFH